MCAFRVCMNWESKSTQEVVAAVCAWTREVPRGVVSQVKESTLPQVSQAHTSVSINESLP